MLEHAGSTACAYSCCHWLLLVQLLCTPICIPTILLGVMYCRHQRSQPRCCSVCVVQASAGSGDAAEGMQPGNTWLHVPTLSTERWAMLCTFASTSAANVQSMNVYEARLSSIQAVSARYNKTMVHRSCCSSVGYSILHVYTLHDLYVLCLNVMWHVMYSLQCIQCAGYLNVDVWAVTSLGKTEV